MINKARFRSTAWSAGGTAGQRSIAWLLFSLLSLAAPAAWSKAELPDPDQATRGTLYLRGEQGVTTAPTLNTEVDMQITGLIAEVQVDQRFHNPGTQWTEAVYVFPLPGDAAVRRMRIQVGERLIEGRIEERQRAEKTYAEARKAGKKAGLVRQERPNIFTTSVANIGPGEQVSVHIEYQQSVSYADGEFSLRFPLVVGPRYIPGAPAAALNEHINVSHGWARDTDRVPDASRITPPVAHPDDALINPLSLSIQLAPGAEPAMVDSRYHPIRIQGEGMRRSISLRQSSVPADRDFELVWRLQPSAQPRAAFFTETTEQAVFGLLMVAPPGKQALQRLNGSRELILVIDTSGSMHGASMRQAKAAVRLALDGLRPADRFNLIAFSNQAQALHPAAVTATPAALRAARRWVDRLEANGGTEMRPALQLALGARAREAGGLSQVVFITDGAVGNEEELFRVIRERLGDARLFTVAIGSAPNSWFMRKAARFGRGSFTHIGRPDEVADRMGALLQRLEYPALTDIRIVVDDAEPISAYPSPLPDLYPGEPLMLALRLDTLPKSVSLSGRFAQQPWHSRIDLGDAAERPGIAAVWARRRIEHLMEQHMAAPRGEQREVIERQVVDTALAHHLVSRFTSLVAVDVTPSRPAREEALSQALKTRLPHGWSHEKVFGMANTATPATLNLLAGLLLMLIAAGMALRGGRT